MQVAWRRIASRSSGVDPLLFGGLLWLGTLAGLARGIAWPLIPLGALMAMFVAVQRARSVSGAAAAALAFGLGEAGVCFFGTVSWGWQVPLILTVVCVATHHLPLALWSRVAPRVLTGSWLWVATIGLSATSNSLAELVGAPSREAVVLVTWSARLLGGVRLFGADLVTAVIEACLLLAAIAACRVDPRTSIRERLARGLRQLLIGLALLGATALLANSTSAPSSGTIRVGIPQVNADASYYKSRLLAPSIARAFEQQFSELNANLARAELVITTEGFDGRFGLMLPAVRARWAERAKHQRQAWLLTSYIVKEDGRKSNAAGGFSAEGKLVGIHEKVDLAPFGERDLAPGSEFRPLAVAPGVKLGVLICQESYLQGGAVRLARAGATLLATTTSDITFGSSTTVLEHLAMAQLRAIETGRAMVWASNGGPSGVIDRWGRFEPGPFRVPAAVTGSAELFQDATPFVRYATAWRLAGPVLLVIGLLTARRQSAAAGAAFPRAFEPLLTVTRALLGVGFVALAAATTLLSSAAFEARWGNPRRAWPAITDLLAKPATFREPDAYQRFKRAEHRSAEGAVAYLLEYYGLDSDETASLAQLPDSASLGDIQRFLSDRYGLATRRVSRNGTLPLTPMLLRAGHGDFAVVDYAGSGRGGLIDFGTGQSRYVSPRELWALPNIEALLPFEASHRTE